MPRVGKTKNPLNENGLTDKQQCVLDFIADEIQYHHLPPTNREIGKRFGIVSPNGVAMHLRALERKGKITIQPRISRGISIVGQKIGPQWVRIPNAVGLWVLYRQNEIAARRYSTYRVAPGDVAMASLIKCTAAYGPVPDPGTA